MTTSQAHYATVLSEQSMSSGEHTISVLVEDGQCQNWVKAQPPESQINLCIGVAQGEVDVGTVWRRCEFVGSAKVGVACPRRLMALHARL
jgi:hypothetical protein